MSALAPAFRLPTSAICLLAALVWLWWRLVDQLRIEWSVNPQYAYGWAVPFLCAYLLWQRLRKTEGRGQRAAQCKIKNAKGKMGSTAGRRRADGGGPTAEDGERRTEDGGRRAGFRFSAFSFQLLFWGVALLYFPTRLIQEANPEWRMVSWALAFEVILITFLVLHQMAEAGGRKAENGGQMTEDGGRVSAFQRFSISPFIFPLGFFLVAVPWPTLVEAPVVQFLTRANAAVTIEILNTLGIPALQRGSVIEISAGLVGIDDACSGIRSLQATLMLSLFLGDLYRLSIFRRVAFCLAGFALAFLFNIGRTFLLVYVASRDGIAAIDKWHDPAGVTILVGCFLGLWLLGLRLARGQRAEDGGQRADFSISPSPHFSFVHRPAFALIAWIILTEVAVEAWYRSHERQLGAPVAWVVEFPQDADGFKKLTIPDIARQMLRYDEGKNVQWSDPNASWQLIYLRWNAGRIAAHLARSHTPEVCLTAAGHELEVIPELKIMTLPGIRLPFRAYSFRTERGPVFVFYCLWEDRQRGPAFDTEMLTYGSRMAAIREGRRNLGQRSLEVAVGGLPDLEQATTAVQRQLERLIQVPPAPRP